VRIPQIVYIYHEFRPDVLEQIVTAQVLIHKTNLIGLLL
jgi:hypothetical protein